MDDRMMSQLLETYGFAKGAPVSPRNANMIREFGAANPDVLERRANRMRGSIQEDNTDLLDAMLEKHIAETAAPSITQTPLAAPEMAPQQRQAPAGPRRMSNTYPNPNEAQGGPIRSSAQAGDPDNIGMQQNAPSASGSMLPEWLLAALGVTSAAGSAAMAPGARPQKALPRAIDNSGLIEGVNPSQRRIGYQPKLEDGTPNPRNMESIGDEMQDVTNRRDASKTGRNLQLQEEVRIENETNDRLMQQLMQRNKAQTNTRELTDAAKRAVGRK